MLSPSAFFFLSALPLSPEDTMHFEISRAVKPGKQLTPAQRSSSLFAEEPRIGAVVLRRGSAPLKLSEPQYAKLAPLLKRLFLAGSIDITAVSGKDRMSLTTALEKAKLEANRRKVPPGEVVKDLLKQAFSFAVDEARDLLREDHMSATLKADFDALGVSVVKIANQISATLPDGRTVETTEEVLMSSSAPLMDTLTALADGQQASKELVDDPGAPLATDGGPATDEAGVTDPVADPVTEPAAPTETVATEEPAPEEVPAEEAPAPASEPATEPAPELEAAPGPVPSEPEADTVAAPAPEAKSEKKSKKGRQSTSE